MGTVHYKVYVYNFSLLSQRGPEHPARHVQLKFPVDSLTGDEPLFIHEQVLTETTKYREQSASYSLHRSAFRLAN